MRLVNIEVEGFRLFKKVSLGIEEKTTAIVGRNNSGKTSLTEIFRRLLGGNTPVFQLEDFSLGLHDKFWEAFSSRGKSDQEIRELLPIIKIQLSFSYKPDEDLGPLTDFVIDLDPSCKEAIVEIRYEVEDGKIQKLFDDIKKVSGTKKKQKEHFFKVIKERIPKCFAVNLFAVDPNKPENRKKVEWPRLLAVLQGGFINAQRGLDDLTHKENDVLGKIFGVLFATALSNSASAGDRTTAQELADAVQTIQEDTDEKFNKQLTNLLPAFALFGYKGLPDPALRTQTIFDVQRLLNNHTKIVYSGVNGVHLPEAFNGLGVRNLIFILLKLYELFKIFQSNPTAPGVHVIFIEEPEAHLHPQMQEVFISKLGEVAAAFVKKEGGREWPVQFVVTTHSSHIANKAHFSAIRYFLAVPPAKTPFCETKIKDLRKGLTGVSAEDKKFLHQYMSLTRCDLLFADKIILIEGTSERLLLPRMIEKLDDGKPPEKQLSSQYVSILEVGGAYAHRFFGLLGFLELRTLIITDIDSAKFDKGRYVAEEVQSSTHTTNACIKEWFGDKNISPATLISKTDAEKIKGSYRLAYQVPESGKPLCGRSFEEMFIITNPKLFDNSTTAWEQAKAVKKSEFALHHAIENTEWKTPRYIAEGLEWLSESDV